MITDDRERARLVALRDRLEENMLDLRDTYSFLLVDALDDAYGANAALGAEDITSITSEPRFRRMSSVIDDLSAKHRQIVAKLSDDGTNPPF